jgi:hypothetical protein
MHAMHKQPQGQVKESTRANILIHAGAQNLAFGGEATFVGELLSCDSGKGRRKPQPRPQWRRRSSISYSVLAFSLTPPAAARESTTTKGASNRRETVHLMCTNGLEVAVVFDSVLSCYIYLSGNALSRTV